MSVFFCVCVNLCTCKDMYTMTTHTNTLTKDLLLTCISARARARSLLCVQQSVEENPIASLCRQTPSDAEKDAGNDAPSDTATKDDDRSSASKAPDAADAKDETREQIKVV